MIALTEEDNIEHSKFQYFLILLQNENPLFT